jgi:D-sedoheptulose 7-phosphate isomerase
MTDWISEYLRAQAAAHRAIPVEAVVRFVGLLREALQADRQIFVFGNGGSAANAAHFATDLGKGASDRLPRRFRVMALTDNVSWLTALANDYSYEEVFVRPLQNFARAGDVAIGISVSGNSPNCVRALAWAREHGLRTVALVGGRPCRMAELAELVLSVPDTHYGRVEDAHMTFLHLACYAFMEHPEWAEVAPGR